MKEEWKVVKGYPDYEITKAGIVRRIKTKKIMTYWINPNTGVVHVSIYGSTGQALKSVARLVLSTFGDEDITHRIVKHKDDNKLNVHFDNLFSITTHEHRMKQEAFRKITKVKVVETGEVFSSVAKCAHAFEAAAQDIRCCLNNSMLTYAGYHFIEVK